MTNWTVLNNAIRQVIYSNGTRDITGQILQTALLNIVNSVGSLPTFGGTATPSTNPGVHDGPVFYIATAEGTYSNFNNIAITKSEVPSILICTDGTWVKQVIGTALAADIEALVTSLSTEVSRAQAKEAELQEAIADQNDEIEDFKSAITDQVNNYHPIVIEGDVTNAADEEDLTSENGLLKIKNRSALNGMGYVILRRGSSFASQVTLPNTIYEVRYNFDLNGAEVTIPANCVLQFTGGSVSNGTLDLNDCKIQADTAIFSNISLADNCVFTQDIKPEWFGAKGNGVTDSTSAWASAIAFAKKIKLEGAAFRNQFGQGVRIVADKHNRYLLSSNLTIDARISIVGGFTFLYNGSKTPYLGVINLEGDIYYQEYSFSIENVSSWKRDFSDGIMTCGISLGNPNATTSLGINILKDINVSGFYNAIQLYGDAISGTDYVYQHTFNNISSTYCVNCFYIHSEGGSWHNSNTFRGITLNVPSSGWTLPTAPFPCVVFYFYSDGNYTPNSLTFENVYLEGYRGGTYYSLLFKIQSSTNTSADPSGWQFRSIRVENTNTELHAECDCLAFSNTAVDMLYHNKKFKVQLKETTISEGDGTLIYNGIAFSERPAYEAMHKLVVDGNSIIRNGYNGSKYIQTDNRYPLTKLTSTEIKAVTETSSLSNFNGYYCCAIKIAPQQEIYICRSETFVILFTLFNENEQRVLFGEQTDLLISTRALRVIPYSGKDYVGPNDSKGYGLYVFTNNSANTYYLVPQINGNFEIKSNKNIELKEFDVPAKVNSNYPTIKTVGQNFYNTSSNTSTWWNGSKWICADGFEAGLYRRGDTSSRPTLTTTDAGFQYFDTDLGKPIYWTGAKWVDATGADLT